MIEILLPQIKHFPHTLIILYTYLYEVTIYVQPLLSYGLGVHTPCRYKTKIFVVT